MKIMSGGQTGVDRAALDLAIARGMPWGGWCPKGGWAEDLPEPPGLLPAYPHLHETPLAHPVQRTEWVVRDSNATLILTDGHDVSFYLRTRRAVEWARQHGKPFFIVDLNDPTAPSRAVAWLKVQRTRFGPDLALCVCGPRESEAPGAYDRARSMLSQCLDCLS